MPPSSHSHVTLQPAADRMARAGAWQLKWFLPPLTLAAFVYIPALNNGFSLDDFNWLARAAEAMDGGLLAFVLEPEPGQIFSPVPKLLLALSFWMFGPSPFLFHLCALALHLVNVALIQVIGEKLSGRQAGFIAAVLFAVWPASSEAVFWLAAFFHPLATALYLVTLLAFLQARRSGGSAIWVFRIALILALMTKAMAFALAPALLLFSLLQPNKSSGGRLQSLTAWSIGCSLLLALVNLGLGIRDSYLLERELYATGVHWLPNLWHYIRSLGFPFPELTTRVGLGAVAVLFSAAGGVLVLVVILQSVVRSDWRPKWWASQILFCLAPVLPFTLSPTSRYLYLATVPFALLTASLVSRWLMSPDLRPTGISLNRRKLIVVTALTFLVAAAWAELRLTDNHYEYREQQMAAWVADIANHHTNDGLPALTIIGLPTVGIDSGIHLESALRLHWKRPHFSLQVLPTEPQRRANQQDSTPTLWYDQGQFKDRPTNDLTPPIDPRP